MIKLLLTAGVESPSEHSCKGNIWTNLEFKAFFEYPNEAEAPTMILFSNYLLFKHFGPFFRHIEFLLKLWVQMQHCDYFDLWGKGTKVTVASGKSHLKLKFEIISLFCSSFCVSRTTQTFWEFVWIWNFNSSKFICCKCTWISSLYSHFKLFVGLSLLIFHPQF